MFGGGWYRCRNIGCALRVCVWQCFVDRRKFQRHVLLRKRIQSGHVLFSAKLHVGTFPAVHPNCCD